MLRMRDMWAAVTGAGLVCACFVVGFVLISGRGQSPAEATSPSTAAAPAEASATSQPTGLVIRKAVYGDLPDGPAVDVTQKVVAAAGKMAVVMDASNDNFGDPAPGIAKKLRVDYLANGAARSRTVNEGETLSIRIKSGPVRLVIRSAVYGELPNGSSTDVTEKVMNMTDGDALSVAASNDNFGDPAPGITKQLRVVYTIDGREKTREVSEGETLAISADD
ncbi:MAG TPA: hypothetical protein VHM90_17555 [Phycisphaerae bacterium]|nr:hypothetical protein [Phycisphaerae bacterium]